MVITIMVDPGEPFKRDKRNGDDGSPPSQAVIDYLAAIAPKPVRILGKTMIEMSKIERNKSLFVIQNGELCGLKLQNLDFSANPSFIFPDPSIAPHLKKLILIECNLRPIHIIISFPELEELRISDNKLTDFQSLTLNIPKVEELSFFCPNLENLSGLPKSFSHLSNLGINNCPGLLDLTGFPTSLPTLRVLSLQNSNLGFLKLFPCEAPNLEYIDVSGCKFRDFTFLLSLGKIFHKTLQWGRDHSISSYEKTQGIVHYYFIHLPELRSFDGLTQSFGGHLSELRSFDGLLRHSIFQLISSLISARLDYKYDDGLDKNFRLFKTHKDQFPSFFRTWAEQWEEIKAREWEYPRGYTFDTMTDEMEDQKWLFEDQKTTDLIAHIERLFNHYQRTLTQLLDATLHADPLNNWPSDFTPELIERVVHECSLKKLHNVLEFLPPSHPLQGFWHKTVTTQLSGSNSEWSIVL